MQAGAADDRVALPPGTVDVWVISLDHDRRWLAGLAAHATDSDRRRAARFSRDGDRQRFLVGRGSRRHMLGRYTGLSPAGLAFARMPAGKPCLVDHGNLRFSTSRTRDLLVHAVALDFEVGIDVETVPTDPRWLEIGALALASAERAALLALPESERLRALSAIWTCKEAYVKMQGIGLHDRLGAICFDVGATPRLRYDRSGFTVPRPCSFTALHPSATTIGCLACWRAAAVVRRFDLTPAAGPWS